MKQFNLSIAYIFNLPLFKLLEVTRLRQINQAHFPCYLLLQSPLLGDAGTVQYIDYAVPHPLICSVDCHVYLVTERVILSQAVVEVVVDVSFDQHFL